MKTDGFNYSFAPRELLFLLFGRKTCPACGGRLTKHKMFDVKSGRELNRGSSDPFFVQNADIKDYEYAFRCVGCGMDFSLNELLKG